MGRRGGKIRDHGLYLRVFSSPRVSQGFDMLEGMNAPDEVATTGHGRRGLLLHIVAIGIALLALLLAVGAVVLETVDGDESTGPPLFNEATQTETVPLAANRKYTGPEDIPGLVDKPQIRWCSSSVVTAPGQGGSSTRQQNPSSVMIAVETLTLARAPSSLRPST